MMCLKPDSARSNLSRGQVSLKGLKYGSYDMLAPTILTFDLMFELFCIILQTGSSTNIVLMRMPIETSKPPLSCFFVLSSLCNGSVGITQGPEAMLCSLSAVLWSSLVCRGFIEEGGLTMMHWLNIELHRRFGNFHNTFKSASWCPKMWPWDIQQADWGLAPATQQIA